MEIIIKPVTHLLNQHMNVCGVCACECVCMKMKHLVDKLGISIQPLILNRWLTLSRQYLLNNHA